MKIFCFTILLSLALFACQPNKGERDIYLCIGQSNMAGRAPIDVTVKDTLENVFLLTNDADKLWEKAANPLNKYSTVCKDLKMQKVGPAYGFAQVMAKADPEHEIALVVNAKGGSSIRVWHPDSAFFKEAVRRTKIAMESGELKGIIWHQGCTDAGLWDSYMPQLELMVSELRNQLGQDIPFVAGQLSSDKPSRDLFNAMIISLPEHIANAAVVSSEGLSTIDGTHFDTQSQRLIGQRYAEKMQILQKR